MTVPSRASALFAFALAIGAAVRVAALPLPGTEDVGVWRHWSYHASLDVTRMYGVGGNPPTRALLKFGKEYTVTDYPPVALYELGIAGIFYRAVYPGYPNDWRLTAAVKIPGLLAGACLTALLYAAARRLTGRQDLARLAALAWWLNPATILNAETLGYLDALLMLPAVAAVWLIHQRRFWWAGCTIAIAGFTKPQAALIGPVTLLALARLGGWRALAQATAAGSATTAAIFLPFVLAGSLPNVVVALSSFARTDILSGYAANAWWVVNWLERAWHLIPRLGVPESYFVPVARVMALSTFLELGWANPRPLATTAVLALVGWAVWRFRRTDDLATHAALAAFTVLVYFSLAIGVHENHIVLALPFLLLAAVRHTAFRPAFVVLSLSAALNMNVFYGLGRGVGWALPRTATLVDTSVLLAFLNLAMLAWFARQIARRTAPSSDTSTASPASYPRGAGEYT
jgi:Glycosyltransferase family 87